MSARSVLSVAPARTHTYASRLPGHQRSCHGVILPRKESKYILDSGSKSQQQTKNSGISAAFQPVESKRRARAAFCLGGTAGSYLNRELVLISLCYGVCCCILATGRSLFLRSVHISFTLFQTSSRGGREPCSPKESPRRAS